MNVSSYREQDRGPVTRQNGAFNTWPKYGGLVVLLLGTIAHSVHADVAAVVVARQALATGDYAAAAKSCEGLLNNPSDDAETAATASLLLSQAHQEQGHWEQAQQSIETALKRHAEQASLWSRLAQIQYLRGDHAAARTSAAHALQRDPDDIAARLIEAHVHREAGEFDEALDGYLWCVRYYNRRQPVDADTLLLVAEGSLEYARWKGVSSIDDFVLNTLCPDALAADPHCWQASLLSGQLLLEKYNRPQALQELRAALKINPRAAEAYVAVGMAALQEYDLVQAQESADLALDINPRLPSALRLAADVRLAEGNPAEALELTHRALDVNAVDQQTLARQAVCILVEYGTPDPAQLQSMFTGPPPSDATPGASSTRFEQLYADLVRRNPKPGEFLTTLGEFFDAHRQYALARLCYERSIEVMPQLAAPRTALGLLAMRTGQLDEARQILDDAFRADPYHVRVHNMRKVLEVLSEHRIIESDHFFVRVPPDEQLLGDAMAAYLEDIYPELTRLFGFEPEQKTQIEVYGPSKGHSAHQWFSARMTGLPWIQTIGASTGMIIAMASPHSAPEPFNWARVLRHEFVHILTLQQTGFHIPHWYTEALAVRVEGARPEEWRDLLLKRVPKGETFNLATIDGGFQQPKGPDDWQMAYAQSWLYAEYLASTYGEESLGRLVEAYGHHLSTQDAIKEVCGIEVGRFESDYRSFLEDYVDEISRGRAPLPDELADVTESDDDLARLKAAFDSRRPHPAVIDRLATLYAARDQLDDARHVLETGVEAFPVEDRFLRQLAAVLLRQQDNDALRPILEQLAERDLDDGLIRQKLARLAVAAKDWPAAIHWGREAIHCDVRDVETHLLLGQAYEAREDWPAAIREYETALTLDRTLTRASEGLQRVRAQQASSTSPDDAGR